MIYAGYILLTMLGLRFCVVLVNFFSRSFLPVRKTKGAEPLVSVLIPARNEEQHLPLILSDLQGCGYSNIEVIVCNDHSSDGTEEVLAFYKNNFPALSYFNGAGLSEGWLGKNFACYQLAQRASGDFFLYFDADVRIKPGAIRRMVTYSMKHQLALLSIFPQQIIESEGEWKTVPLMNWILLSFLPLPLARWRRFSSLSAANGQVMLFESQIYRQRQWHEMVKNKNVEDIAIARLVKKSELKMAVLLGNDDVLCRMYTNYSDAVAGFSRNIHQYFGGSRVWLAFFVLISWLRLPFFVLFFSPYWAVGVLCIVFIMKVMVSVMSRQSVLKNFCHPLRQLIALTHIAYKNITITGKGHVEWKGRVYHI